jgi:hypothetical protein
MPATAVRRRIRAWRAAVGIAVASCVMGVLKRTAWLRRERQDSARRFCNLALPRRSSSQTIVTRTKTPVCFSS